MMNWFQSLSKYVKIGVLAVVTVGGLVALDYLKEKDEDKARRWRMR